MFGWKWDGGGAGLEEMFGRLRMWERLDKGCEVWRREKIEYRRLVSITCTGRFERERERGDSAITHRPIYRILSPTKHMIQILPNNANMKLVSGYPMYMETGCGKVEPNISGPIVFDFWVREILDIGITDFGIWNKGFCKVETTSCEWGEEDDEIVCGYLTRKLVFEFSVYSVR